LSRDSRPSSSSDMKLPSCGCFRSPRLRHRARRAGQRAARSQLLQSSAWDSAKHSLPTSVLPLKHWRLTVPGDWLRAVDCPVAGEVREDRAIVGTEAFRWNEVPRYLIHGRAQRSPSAAFSRNQRALGAALGDPKLSDDEKKVFAAAAARQQGVKSPQGRLVPAPTIL